MKIFVVGMGRVGCALALAAQEAGHAVLGGACRSAEGAAEAAGATGMVVTSGMLPATLREAEVALVAIPDDAVVPAGAALAHSGRLSEGAIVLHTAGALGATALDAVRSVGASPGSFHPLQTFPARGDRPSLRGVPFAIAGDATALDAAQRLAESLGGRPLLVADTDRMLYHAAAVLACGALDALLDAAAQALAASARITEKDAIALLAPIARRTLENAVRIGARAALTGPAARGDDTLLLAHAVALAGVSPQIAGLYEALAARARSRLAPEAAQVSNAPA